MSRIGRAPIPVPGGVKTEIAGNRVKVTGPKGTLERTLSPAMKISVVDNTIVVERPSDKPEHRSLHGLTRALINNMVNGVTQGYEKKLTILGVGYRAAMQGKDLKLSLGLSHEVLFAAPDGITITTPTQTEITVSGIDRQQVGQVAANIRSFRKPEPYKGKGIRYSDEYVARKEGKKK